MARSDRPVQFFSVPLSALRRIRSMGTVMEHKPGDTTDLIEQLRGGDRRALAELFDRYRERLGAWSTCAGQSRQGRAGRIRRLARGLP